MASLATLQVVKEVLASDKIQTFEIIIRTELTHPKLKSIQGKGLLLSGELNSKEENFAFIKNCIQDGLITDWFLFADHRFRIAPPLTITEEELRDALSIIKSNLDKL
jgi:acetylornithine/succinyldiaminopimelate/putrescine aminotransferase